MITCSMADHLQQYSEEELYDFAKVYLGSEDVLSKDARDVMLPILIPNSPFIGREPRDLRGHGVFPCYLGTNRLEIQITMNEAKYMGVDATVVPGSVLPDVQRGQDDRTRSHELLRPPGKIQHY